MIRPILFALATLTTGCAFVPFTDTDAATVSQVRAPRPLLLQTDQGQTCNAVRLDDQTIATAAHCVHDQTGITVFEDGKALFAPDPLEHPGYEISAPDTAARWDLAKLRVPATDASTGVLAVRPADPAPVEILALTPEGELQSVPCGFLGRSGALVELSCTVNLGWSGAPVVQNGALVGILSARGQGQTAAIAQMSDATGLSNF